MKLVIIAALMLSALSVAANAATITDCVACSSDKVVIAVGDLACGNDSAPTLACKQMQTSDIAVNISPDAFFALGDTQYEKGTYDNFLTYYEPSWGRLKSITHPVPGNHEYMTADAQGYFDYFNGIGVQNGSAGDRSKGYYAFNVGTWRVYAMNSNCDQIGGCAAGSAQEQWLRTDLQANPTQCSIMLVHHPLWVSQVGRDYSSIRPLVQAFYENGGEMLLAGDAHQYERFARQSPLGAAESVYGVREFVVGTGGRNLVTPNELDGNSEVRNGTTFGALKLTLKDGSYDWQFIAISGQAFTDSGSESCHGIPPICGNGVLEGSETCDQGTDNGHACTPAYNSSCNYCSGVCTGQTAVGNYCGDNSTQAANGEQCDDGNSVNGDGCSSLCAPEIDVPEYSTIAAGLALTGLGVGYMLIRKKRA